MDPFTVNTSPIRGEFAFSADRSEKSPSSSSKYVWGWSPSPNRKSPRRNNKAVDNDVEDVIIPSTIPNPFLENEYPNDPDFEDPPSPRELKRDGGAITHNEYTLLAQVFRNIMNAPQEVKDWFSPPGSRTFSMDLARLTGVGEKTCQAAIRLERTGKLEILDSKKRGRPKKPEDKELMSIIMNMVLDSNNRGIPNSATKISDLLRTDYGISRSPSTVTRDLHNLGLY